VTNSSTVSGAERLSVKNINPALVEASYAVRGVVLDRALALKAQLETNPKSLPFSEIVSCNIGNPQSLGQMPLTFFRQVDVL
jgi:alanine transaminase